MQRKTNTFFSIIILLLFISAAFTSCGVKKTAVRTIPAGTFSGQSAVSGHRSSTANDCKLQLTDGDKSLYIDSKTGNIAVRDPGKVWSALPFTSNNTASVFTVSVFNGKEYIVLDTQRNCAAYGTFSFSKSGKTISAVYVLANNDTTAKKSAESVAEGDIYVRLPVEFTFENGCLKAAVDMTAVITAPGLYIDTVAFMPYFCSVPSSLVSGENFNDWVLVPDGTGAVISSKTAPTDYNETSFAVYGGKENASEASLPAFGVKNSSFAVAGIITDGQAVAVIKSANASAKTSKAQLVYPEFSISEVNKKADKISYTDSYKGKIEVTYRFLNGENAGYMGIAAAVRAVLIRDNKLPDHIADDTCSNMNIIIDGSVDGTKKTTLSRYEDIEDIISVLKGKNINNANIILNGFFDGGIMQKPLSSVKMINTAGTRKEFSSLCDYAKKQGYGIYLGSNLMYFSGSFASAETPAGNKPEKTVSYAVSSTEKNNSVLRMMKTGKLESNCIKLMNFGVGKNITGFALADVNEPIVTDIVSGIADRQAAADLLEKNIASFGVLSKLIVNGCSTYSLGSADAAINIPYTTSNAETDYYKAVPFVPAVLHSSVLYSGAPANTTPVTKLELLKTVEYGGVPFFRWTMNGNSAYYYENTIKEAAEFCSDAAVRLNGIQNKRMTAHYEVQSGVFCTEYSSETLVYVNYNNYSVNIGDIAVMPYDYIRIN